MLKPEPERLTKEPEPHGRVLRAALEILQDGKPHDATGRLFEGDSLPAQGGPAGRTIRRGDSGQYCDENGFRTHPGNETGVRGASSQEVKDAESRPEDSSH